MPLDHSLPMHVVPLDLLSVSDRELVQRVKALEAALEQTRFALRRVRAGNGVLESYRDLSPEDGLTYLIDTAECFTQVVSWSDEGMARSEFTVLEILHQSYPRVVSRGFISDNYPDRPLSDDAIRTIVKRLRAKGWQIDVARSIGYNLSSLDNLVDIAAGLPSYEQRKANNDALFDEMMGRVTAAAATGFRQLDWSGILGHGKGVRLMVDLLPNEAKVPFLVKLLGHLSCKDEGSQRHGGLIPSRALHLMQMCFPLGVSRDAFVASIYDDRNLDADGYNIPTQIKILRREGYDISCTSGVSYALRTLDRQDGPVLERSPKS